MKKIEAQTLEDALSIAAKTSNCSVVELEYEIIQNPTKGFLGIGRKPAIICVECKNDKKPVNENPEIHVRAESLQSDLKQDLAHDSLEQHSIQSYDEHSERRKRMLMSKEELQRIAKEVQEELESLLKMLSYDLDSVLVEPYDENTLYVKIDGADSALLIGKEGYRYKAISYLIFNWVNYQYGLMIRLEIAEFLRNQEEMIANYLLPTIESVKATGKAQTKPLDGVLAHIALKQLREQFPDKYVSFRTNSEGERYIVVNAFYHS